MDEAENQITDLEHKKAKNNQLKQQEEKRIPKNDDSVSSLWDNFKHSNKLITGVPEGEEKEQETGNLFEKIMKENFPILVKEIDIQVQEVQKIPIMMDAKRSLPRQIIIKGQRLNIKRHS